MEYQKTDIEGVFLVKPRVFGDARGYFVETWKQADVDEHVGKVTFIQDNESKSSHGVLRGLHYQKGEWSQAKLVRVIKGRVLDVAVDKNKLQLFIPRGFAHGFLVLSDEAIFTYKVDNVYAPQAEAGIRWNDPALGIEWPVDPTEVLTSEKDLKQPLLKDAWLF